MPETLPYFTPGGERLVPVASFPTSFLAELAGGALRAEGVTAIILGGNAAALGAPANGIGGTQVNVPLFEVARARQILADLAAKPPEGKPWNCPECKEVVPANFDVCWNCGTARSGEGDPDFRSISFSPVCQTCGYPLFGLPDNVCPECGTEFEKPRSPIPAPDDLP